MDLFDIRVSKSLGNDAGQQWQSLGNHGWATEGKLGQPGMGNYGMFWATLGISTEFFDIRVSKSLGNNAGQR